MAKRVNHMPRTREYFERLGWIYEKTEHYNPFAGRTTDFCNFADAIAFIPDSKRTVAIQVTTSCTWRKREKKILANGRALAWLMAGNEIWIVHYKPYEAEYTDARGARRKRREFEMRINHVQETDFGRSECIELPVPTADLVGGTNAQVIERHKEMIKWQDSRA